MERIATDYAPAVNLMTSFRAEMKTYVENRFLNLAAAAEAYHRLKHPEGTQIPAAEWEYLQERMFSVVPDKHQEWVSKKLVYLNDPILMKRLRVLGTSSLTGDSNQKIRRWAETIKDVRNELTHRKSEGDVLPSGVLHWLAESVYQVLRVCLLKECIADKGALDQLAISSPRASELESHVSTALTEARKIVRRRRAMNTEPPPE